MIILQDNLLVTGVPRSGTTFLGRVIAFSPLVNYLWEPFNQKYRKGIPDYYPYIGHSSSFYKKQIYKKIINDTIKYKNLNSVININKNDNFAIKLFKFVGINKNFFRYKLCQIKNYLFDYKILLIKDPIAIFLTEYLIKEFDFKVIVSIRHPAAVYDSRKKLNWIFNYNWWERQKDFNKDILKEHKYYHLNFKNNLIINSSVHWLICYSYIDKLVQQYKENILIVRHEDLSNKPIEEYRYIYKWLSLEFDDKISHKINKITKGNKIEKTSSNLAKLESRNSQKVIFKWKESLTIDELKAIENITYKISKKYYKDKKFWTL